MGACIQSRYEGAGRFCIDTYCRSSDYASGIHDVRERRVETKENLDTREWRQQRAAAATIGGAISVRIPKERRLDGPSWLLRYDAHPRDVPGKQHFVRGAAEH